jgi:thymidylate kinase
MYKSLEMNTGRYLIQILEETGVEYAVIHGWENLPDNLSSDLDIVISPPDLSRLVKSLLRLTLVNILKHEATCFYFVLVTGKNRTFALLDAATDYRRNGCVWFDNKALLHEKVRYKDFWIACPTAEFRYLLVKKILKKSFPKQSRDRILHLKRELGESAKHYATELLGKLWGMKVIFWIESQEWDTLERHTKVLKRVLLWEQFRQNPLNSARYWIPEILRALRRWHEPTGFCVGILGPDGSGKSTIIGTIQSELLGAFRQTAQMHLLPGLIRKNSRQVNDPHGKPPRTKLASLLKLIYYWLDYTLGYCLKIRPALVHSTLVLFDRYYHDLLVDPRRYRYGAPLWAARLIGTLIPKPDLFILLDLPAEVARSRKPEVSLDEALRLRKRYLDLPRILPNAHVVDAARPLDEVVAEVEDIILRELQRRTTARMCRAGLL